MYGRLHDCVIEGCCDGENCQALYCLDHRESYDPELGCPGCYHDYKLANKGDDPL